MLSLLPSHNPFREIDNQAHGFSDELEPSRPAYKLDTGMEAAKACDDRAREYASVTIVP